MIEKIDNTRPGDCVSKEMIPGEIRAIRTKINEIIEQINKQHQDFQFDKDRNKMIKKIDVCEGVYLNTLDTEIIKTQTKINELIEVANGLIEINNNLMKSISNITISINEIAQRTFTL